MLAQTFSALRSPNYRLWFYGQMVSLVGTWMQTTAQGYLIYELTHSAAYLGYVGFASGLPALVFTLYGGLIADRVSRRKLLVITQSSMMILALVLSGLVFTGVVQPWHILVLSTLLGIATAIDAPTRLSFVAELIPREDMTNAIALNSSMFNIGTIVGPAVSGITYALLGAGWCFLINGLSFLAVIIALLKMQLAPQEIIVNTISAIDQLKVGFRYVFNDSLILTLISSLAILSSFGYGMIALLPAWAVDVMHGDVVTNGWMLSARGIGSLIGALVIAALSSKGVRGKLWTIGSFILPLSFFLFAFTRWLPMALIALGVIGFSFILVVNNTNAIVQTATSDELRGRVMGIYTMVFFGSTPLGSLFAGEVASRWGEPAMIYIGAFFLMGLALFLWFRTPRLRRVE